MATVSEVECVLPGSADEPVVVAKGCRDLCDESVGEHDRAVWATVPVDTQVAVFAEFFDCEEELLEFAAPFGPGFGPLTIPVVIAEVGNDLSAACEADAGADAAWVPDGPLTIPGVIAEVGNDDTAAGCEEADAGADAAWVPDGPLTIPGVITEVGDAGADVLRDLLDLREAVLAAQDRTCPAGASSSALPLFGRQ